MSQSLLTQILLPKGERLPTSKQNDKRETNIYCPLGAMKG